MIRIATKEDLPLVIELAEQFASLTPYKQFIESSTLEVILTGLVEGPLTEKLVLLNDDNAFLAAAIVPFPFGFNTKVATEIGWYVKPEVQKQGIGDQLIEAFEYWANKLNIEVKTLAFMDKNLSKYMKKKGYVPYETAHYKIG